MRVAGLMHARDLPPRFLRTSFWRTWRQDSSLAVTGVRVRALGVSREYLPCSMCTTRQPAASAVAQDQQTVGGVTQPICWKARCRDAGHHE